jgi:hypothetical protein
LTKGELVIKFPYAVATQAAPWLARAAELGLGTNDPEIIDFVEVSLG